MRRKICVVTGARSEYGLLYWLMKEIQGDSELELQIIATGMHLSPEFGLTYRVIEQDGFYINEKVEMLLASDTPVGITKSIGLGVIGFADALERLQPDLLILLGDRFEILATAQAALVARLPIAHIHGGETTEGAIDEAIRHSITKMAQIHFVANENYRKRVIQMGEDPERVLNFGAPGLDNILGLKLLSRKQLEKVLDFRLGLKNFLVTYHPATLQTNSEQVMKELLTALDRFPDANIIFTRPNADAGSRVMVRMIDDYVRENPDRTKAYTSLGQLHYLSAMKNVDVVIGNSSSGLIEAPFLKKPAVNIGDRQKGRLKAMSVIDSGDAAAAIAVAIKTALSSEFKQLLRKTVSLYGDGNTSFKIKEFVKQVSLDDIIIKHFYDLESCN